MREPVHRRFMNWSQLFMISEGNSEEDDGGESFGEQAMRERMNAELQEIVSSQNIVAFIKVGEMTRRVKTDDYQSSILTYRGKTDLKQKYKKY